MPLNSWYTDAINKRNVIMMRLGDQPAHAQLRLLMSNDFQAGLDALDPDCPCYVQDRAIQECIYLGLRFMLSAMGLFDVVLYSSMINRL